METKTKKQNESEKNAYVETVRVGAIGANIFRGQAQDGLEYHYFKLSRSWKSSKRGTEGYSDRYFPKFASAISAAATRAAERCEGLDSELQEDAEVSEPQDEASPIAA